MFEPTSRYYNLKREKLTTPQGSTLTYVRRRFLPQGKNLPLLGEVIVTEGDRLALITNRTLGDPEQFWQVCDANDAMNPIVLTAELGRFLRIPRPQV
jgi:hypothetical protein